MCSSSMRLRAARNGRASRWWRACRFGVPMLDIHTAGAGGGSIRALMREHVEGGAGVRRARLRPVCFGRGTLPTVTDVTCPCWALKLAGCCGRREAGPRARGEIDEPENGRAGHGGGVCR